MHETVLNSGWDTFLFAVPALFMLVMGIFRLDELLVAPQAGCQDTAASVQCGRKWPDSAVRPRWTPVSPQKNP